MDVKQNKDEKEGLIERSEVDKRRKRSLCSLESCFDLSFDSLISNTALHNDEVQIALYFSCPNSDVYVTVSGFEHSTC